MDSIKLSAFLLLFTVAGIAGGLAVWKYAATKEANAAAANQPEHMESIEVAIAKAAQYHRKTTCIGTIIALRSITLRNELSGTVSEVRLKPGQIVEEGSLLLKIDISVEEAELKAQKAQAELAETTLKRMQEASKNRAASEIEVDRAAAELDVSRAQIARIQAIIARKTIRAPFRARVGLIDVHPGQYLYQGTELTTLQGVDKAVHVDFSVPQQVAEELHAGQTIDIVREGDFPATNAKIIALDARVDSQTRNEIVRARIDNACNDLAPGSSVRVQVPVGQPRSVVAVPASALRKGPQGDYLFVIEPNKNGANRAHLRQVKSGAMMGDEIAIFEGLTPGEKIASSGAFKLRDMSLVAIVNGLNSESERTKN